MRNRCLCLQSFQPAKHLIRILISPFLRNRAFDDSISISSQVISPVAEFRISAVYPHALILDGLQCDRCCLRCSRDHVDTRVGWLVIDTGRSLVVDWEYQRQEMYLGVSTEEGILRATVVRLLGCPHEPSVPTPTFPNCNDGRRIRALCLYSDGA